MSVEKRRSDDLVVSKLEWKACGRNKDTFFESNLAKHAGFRVGSRIPLSRNGLEKVRDNILNL